RLRVQMLEDLDGFLDRLQLEAGLALDNRQAIVLNVLQVVLDEDAQDVAVRRLGRDLQQEALAQVAGADAARIELLHDRQRLFPLAERNLAVEVLANNGEKLGGGGLLHVAEVAALVDIREQMPHARGLLLGQIEKRKLI